MQNVACGITVVVAAGNAYPLLVAELPHDVAPALNDVSQLKSKRY